MQLARVLLVTGLLAACGGNRGAATLDNKAASARNASLAANEPLAFLPADSELVVGIDFQQVKQSPLWSRYSAEIPKFTGSALTDFKTKCGYDPIATLRGVSLGFKNISETPAGVLVVRGLDRDKTMACFPQIFASKAPAKQIKIDGAFITLPPEGGTSAVLTFVDASTMVFLMSPTASRAELEAALAAEAPLRKSAAFGALWTRVDAKQPVWGLVHGKALASLSSLGATPTALTGTINFASGVALNGRLQFASADQATQVATALQGQAGMAKAFVEKLDVAAAGNDVTFAVSMTTQQVDALAGPMMNIPLP